MRMSFSGWSLSLKSSIIFYSCIATGNSRLFVPPAEAGSDNVFVPTQGLTTPTRAKAARVGDPGTPWASIISPLRGLHFAQFIPLYQPKLSSHMRSYALFAHRSRQMPGRIPPPGPRMPSGTSAPSTTSCASRIYAPLPDLHHSTDFARAKSEFRAAVSGLARSSAVLPGEQCFEFCSQSAINVHARLPCTMSVEHHPNGRGKLRLQQIRRQLGDGHRITQSHRPAQNSIRDLQQRIEPRAAAGKHQSRAQQIIDARLAQVIAQQFHQLARPRLQNFSQHALLHEARGAIAHRRHFDFIALGNARDDGAAEHFLDVLGVGNRGAEAHSHIVGEMIAADGNGAAVDP